MTALHAGWGTAERPRLAVSATPGVDEAWDSFVYTFMYRVDDGEWVDGSKAVRLGPGYEVRVTLTPALHVMRDTSGRLVLCFVLVALYWMDERQTLHTRCAK